MTDTARQMDAYIQQNLDRYLQETIRLCAQPSISARGEGIAECAALVAELLAQHGLRVQVIPTAGNPVVVGHADGASPRTLLCYNHYDVQPPEPLELWTDPPFQPTVRDGVMYARGVSDDKGELVSRLAALDAVRAAHGGKLPCGVTCVVEGEEEIGSPHIAQFVLDHLDLLRSDGSIWEIGLVGPEGGAVLPLGVRGILSVELTARTMTKDAHSGNAHRLPNAAWRLAWALNALKGPDERILIPGFYDRVRPPSALDLERSRTAPLHDELDRETYGLVSFVRGLEGDELEQQVFSPTCNIGGLTSGYQGPGTKTVIPSWARAKLDFRLLPDQDPDDIFARLRAHLDAQGFADVEAAYLGSMRPAKTPADAPLVQLTARTGQEVYGQPTSIRPMEGGSSPIYAFAGPLGNIPVVFAGVSSWDSRNHAPDENIRLRDFVDGTRHVARIMAEFGDLR